MVVGDEVVVTTVVVVLVEHAEQQLGPEPTDPPRALHRSADRLTLQWTSPFRPVHSHVTKPGLPQVDLAAQRTILPRHCREASMFTCARTQRT